MPASSLNLLRDPWLPVRRRSGALAVVSVAEALGRSDDPAVAIDWSRADFDAAALEFLVGLMSTVAPPETSRIWRAWWNDPPTTEELVERFSPFAPFFDLDGPGPRFLQDLGDLGEEVSPVSGLLIEQPGANTVKNNTDLFQKRDRIGVLGRAGAAMALFTLQCFAPSGGAGHRTGLRGGGPLTTLVEVPDTEGEAPTLWHRVWLNVLPPLPDSKTRPPTLEAPEHTFPWLAPARTSDKGGVETHAKDIHPAQCFWGMPRRIRLRFEENAAGVVCDLTGRVDAVVVRGYVTRPYGVNYAGVEHPLSPYYRVKADGEWLPVHPQPGGIAWRHWPGFVQTTKGAGGRESRPAKVVDVARDRLADVDLGRTSLRLHGWDMDNMKARAFVETEAPFFDVVGDEATRNEFHDLIGRLVASASQAVSILSGNLRAATGRDGGARLDLVQETFWAETEGAFRKAIEAARRIAETGAETEVFFKEAWIGGALAPAVLAAFDREVPAETMAALADIDGLKRAVEARRNLIRSLHGWGKSGADLWKAAGLEPPASSNPKPKKGAAR